MDKLARLSERLQLNKFKLQTLLDITNGINDNLPISQLIAIYRGIVEGELDLTKLLLFGNTENGWEILLHYGDEGNHLPALNSADLTSHTEIQVLSNQSDQIIDGFDVLIPVLHNKKALGYLFIGDMDESISMSPIINPMNFLQTLTNILAVAIENKRLMRESIRQERLRRELELAGEMQAMLVPSSFHKNEVKDVHALYFPHQEVGGDYYDQFSLTDGREVVCIADVSGKGISAAFLMANFQARLRALIEIEVESDMVGLIHRLNQSVVEATNGDRFITFFISIYDPEDRSLNYVNAGHNPPLIIGQEAQWLKKGCMGLGMVDLIPRVEVGTITFAKADSLICFTDGLIEVENDSGHEYGEERLRAVVEKNSKADMSTLNYAIQSDFNEFRGSNPPHDDFALLSVRFF